MMVKKTAVNMTDAEIEKLMESMPKE